MFTSNPRASDDRRAAIVALAVATLAAARDARADAKAECLTAVDQGQSLRDDGKYLRAREAFASCARNVCPAVVAKKCTQWQHEIDETIPTVVFAAKDERGADIASVRVTLDGAPLTERLDGRPLQIDPGEHVLRFEREGSAPIEQRVVARASEKNRIVSVTFRALRPEPPPPPPPADERLRTSASSARIVTAIALGVVGVAAAGAGIYFGAQSRSQADDAATLRGAMPSTACTHGPSAGCQRLSDAVDAQNRDATLSTVGFVAGGVFVAGAIVTWLAWPTSAVERRAWIAPAFGPRSAGVGLGGRF